LLFPSETMDWGYPPSSGHFPRRFFFLPLYLSRGVLGTLLGCPFFGWKTIIALNKLFPPYTWWGATHNSGAGDVPFFPPAKPPHDGEDCGSESVCKFSTLSCFVGPTSSHHTAPTCFRIPPPPLFLASRQQRALCGVIFTLAQVPPKPAQISAVTLATGPAGIL